jgi:hypothetical protein
MTSDHITETITFDTTASITVLMMEAASTSETLLNFYQTTRHNIPEDSHLHTRRRENLKSTNSCRSQEP